MGIIFISHIALITRLHYVNALLSLSWPWYITPSTVVNISIPELHLESGALSVCHEVRDLGIVVSDCLSPSAHVADVDGRAS